MQKTKFANILGFKNTIEAICCLGPEVFNDQFNKFLIYEKI